MLEMGNQMKIQLIPFTVFVCFANWISGFVLTQQSVTDSKQTSIKMGPDWVRVTEKAPWRPRDSQGELVHDNHLWILGT